MDEGAYFYEEKASKSKCRGNFVNKYLKLGQEVTYLAVDSLVHPVLVQSHEKKKKSRI